MSEGVAGAEYVATALGNLLDVLSQAIADTEVPQKRLAAMVGLSEKHVSQMMTGRVDGSLQAWSMLCAAAGVTVRVQVYPPAAPPGRGEDVAVGGGEDG